MNKFKIVIGDYSLNGHEKFSTFILESNMSKMVIQGTYRDIMLEVGTSPSDFCEEDNEIPLYGLIAMGLNPNDYKYLNYTYGESTSCTFNARTYCGLIIDYIKTHRPHIVLNIIDDEIPIWDLGNIGYGLFY